MTKCQGLLASESSILTNSVPQREAKPSQNLCSFLMVVTFKDCSNGADISSREVCQVYNSQWLPSLLNSPSKQL